MSSVSSVVPGGVIGLTLEVHQEQSIDPRNKKEEVHLSDASPAVFWWPGVLDSSNMTGTQ